MRFFRTITSLAALAGLLAASACQPLPRPFAPGAGLGNPSVRPPPDSGGVVVQDVAGVPEPVSDALARAMVESLAKQNIPAATSGSNARSRFLEGTATLDDGDRPGGGPIRVQVSWELSDRAGRTLGTETARMIVPRPEWTAPKDEALAPLTEEPARALAALVQNPEPSDAEKKSKSVPLHVRPVTGAPGDGGLMLRRAMEAALDRRGFQVSDRLRDDGLVIAGSVSLGEETNGRRPIEVEWAVLDRSGKELGTLAQQNVVPTATLEGGWGGLAAVIAESAAGGVGALLVRLRAVRQDTRRPAGT